MDEPVPPILDSLARLDSLRMHAELAGEIRILCLSPGLLRIDTVIKRVASFFKHENRLVREAVVTALAICPVPVKLLEYVGPFLCDDDELVRAAALDTVFGSSLGDRILAEDERNKLVAMSRGSHRESRMCAATLMARGAPHLDMMPTLFRLTKDADVKIRYCAIGTLADWERSYAQPPILVHYLFDEEANIRKSVVNWISERAEIAQAALPYLIELLSDEDGEVRFFAAKAISCADPNRGEPMPTLLDAAVSAGNLEIRRMSIQLLAKMADVQTHVVDILQLISTTAADECTRQCADLARAQIISRCKPI